MYSDTRPADPAFPCGESYTTKDLLGNSTNHKRGPLYPGVSVRDWLAAQEQLTDWDDRLSVPPMEMCNALVGRPQPEHGWKCTTPKQWRDMLLWDAEWRAALKYLRADAMMTMRRL